MERRALREGGDLFVRRITPELFDALRALRVQLGLLRALLHVLELDDVAVGHIAVVGALREEEEVAVAVRQFEFRACDELRRVTNCGRCPISHWK